MMLTELYYYYANHPAAKAASRQAIKLFAAIEKAASFMAVMPASEHHHNRETTNEFELSLDRRSRNELTGTLQTKRDGPRLQTQTAPNPATRCNLMDRLSEHTFFPSYAHPDRPQLPNAVFDALVSALRATMAYPDQAVQVLARTILSEVRCIQETARRKLAARQAELNTKRLELLIEQIACALRVEADKLRSRARNQYLAFQRQIAMFTVRRLSRASFPTVAAAFRRDHSTCIWACQVMERRMTAATPSEVRRIQAAARRQLAVRREERKSA
jgi:hypothetical protein